MIILESQVYQTETCKASNVTPCLHRRIGTVFCLLAQRNMIFDKLQAMRNAEKYVAQGKIRAAIIEYRAVVDNDPRDIGTLNMLGDLHAKNREKREAVECYSEVAEYYSGQGFAQKAIAIYKKISRIQPEDVEVSIRLAELYKLKGSLAEARTLYTELAEHYESRGKKLDALAMWKQISSLDPNNTNVCINLAEAYLKEGQSEDAADAYTEAGNRYRRQGDTKQAVNALLKGHELRPTDLRIIEALVKAYSEIGMPGQAVVLLEEILVEEPYNRDVLYLLVDCHIEGKDIANAEKAVNKLVELEPANYPRLLDLIRLYLECDDVDSAARILSMTSEYLLAAGQNEEFDRWITEILDRNSEHLGGLRLLIRYNSWLKDEMAFGDALVRLLEGAKKLGAVEDERYALSHLLAIRPFETEYTERLKAINEEFGFEDDPIDVELITAQFTTFEAVEGEQKAEVAVIERNGFVTAADDFEEKLEEKMRSVEQNGHKPTGAGEIEVEDLDSVEAVEINEPELADPDVDSVEPADSDLDPNETKLRQEIESISYYLDNDYLDLAEKAIVQLKEEFGDREEIAVLAARSASTTNDRSEAIPIGIDEMRSEFGLEETDNSSGDFETHYQTAIAYQEMGLMESAIREFQDAINLTQTDDGSRRFFQCANLLGHCFMLDGMPNFAVTWFLRALEVPDLSYDELQGIWYELGAAYEADGDIENAVKQFERVYAENVDFRDVSSRVKHLMVGS